MEKGAQALGDEAEGLFLRGAGLKEAAEFADLGNFLSLAAGIVEQCFDFIAGGRQLGLCSPALRNLPLLVVLRESQAEGEGNQRRRNGNVREDRTVGRLPPVHEQTRADEHGDEDKVGIEEAPENARARQQMKAGRRGAR